MIENQRDPAKKNSKREQQATNARATSNHARPTKNNKNKRSISHRPHLLSYGLP
jgi:hypothetical protein